MESSSARVADRNKASSAGKLKRRRWPFERRVKIFCAALPLPALILSTVLLWQLNVTAGTFAILLGIVAFVSLLIGVALHEHITRPLQTLSNVVSALREEDFSFAHAMPYLKTRWASCPSRSTGSRTCYRRSD